MSLGALTHTRSSIIVSSTQTPLRHGVVWLDRPRTELQLRGRFAFTSCLALLLQHITDQNRRLASHRRIRWGRRVITPTCSSTATMAATSATRINPTGGS